MQEVANMISIWWIIPAMMAGALIGILLIALVSNDRNTPRT